MVLEAYVYSNPTKSRAYITVINVEMDKDWESSSGLVLLIILKKTLSLIKFSLL